MDNQIPNIPKSNKGLRLALIISLTLLVISVTYIFLVSNPSFSNSFLCQQNEDSTSFNGLIWGDKEERITKDGIKYTFQDIYREEDTDFPILEAVTIENYTYYVPSGFAWAGIRRKIELSDGDTYYITYGGSSNCQSTYLFNKSRRTRKFLVDEARLMYSENEDSSGFPLFWNDYLIYQDCNMDSSGYGISAFNIKTGEIIKIATPTEQMEEDGIGYFLKDFSNDSITVHECKVWSYDCSGEKVLNLYNHLD